MQYLKDEHKAVRDGNKLNVGEWEILDCSSVTPRQMNGEIIIKQWVIDWTLLLRR